MMWGDGFGMGTAGVLWMVVMLAVLVLIVVGVVLLVRGLSGRRTDDQAGYWPQHQPGSPPSSGGRGSGSALQVLEERYARGEIDREEFLQRRQDLLGG